MLWIMVSRLVRWLMNYGLLGVNTVSAKQASNFCYQEGADETLACPGQDAVLLCSFVVKVVIL